MVISLSFPEDNIVASYAFLSVKFPRLKMCETFKQIRSVLQFCCNFDQRRFFDSACEQWSTARPRCCCKRFNSVTSLLSVFDGARTPIRWKDCFAPKCFHSFVPSSLGLLHNDQLVVAECHNEIFFTQDIATTHFVNHCSSIKGLPCQAMRLSMKRLKAISRNLDFVFAHLWKRMPNSFASCSSCRRESTSFAHSW